jgi:hypothetical protein
MTTSFKLSVAGAGACGAAHGQIYKCQPPGGSVEFTDINRGSYCKPMDLPGMTVPAPRGRAGPPRSEPPVSVPGEFPRVDSAEQRARRRPPRHPRGRAEKRKQKLAELRASSTTANRSGAATNAITPSTRNGWLRCATASAARKKCRCPET